MHNKTGNQTSSSEDRWKERLAFTSSAILVFGLFLLKLQPYAARFQTGRHLQGYESIIEISIREPVVAPEVVIFASLTLLIDAAICIVLLASVHMVSRGLWLIRPSNSSTITEKQALNTICDETYIGAFFIGLLTLIFLIALFPALLGAGFQALLMNLLGFGGLISGIIARILFPMLVFIMCAIACYKTFIFLERKSKGARLIVKSWKTRKPATRIVLRIVSWTLLFFTFYITGVIVRHLTYTLDLSLNKRILYKFEDKYIEVNVRLGGATSSVRDAAIKIFDDSGRPICSLIWNPPGSEYLNQFEKPERRQLKGMGNGQYVSLVPVGEFRRGVYEVKLEYSHASLNMDYPFMHLITKRIEKFIVN